MSIFFYHRHKNFFQIKNGSRMFLYNFLIYLLSNGNKKLRAIEDYAE